MEPLVELAMELCEHNRTALAKRTRISRPRIIDFSNGEKIISLDHRLRLSKFVKKEMLKLNKLYAKIEPDINKIINLHD